MIFTRHGIDIEHYPAVKRHLSSFREKLEPRPRHWDDADDGKWEGRKAGSYKWYEIQDNVAYWESFEGPKIIVPAIQSRVDYAPDLTGYYSNDKTSIIADKRWSFLLGILNSPVSWWLTRQSFASRQGGFFEFKPMYVAQLPVPPATERQRQLIDTLVRAIVAGALSGRPEQLLNGFVYELYFAQDLHARELTLFDESDTAGLGDLAALEGAYLAGAVESFAARLGPESRLRIMLSDLQALEVTRLIEGRE